jgi:small subunit ribosomal protein S7
MPRKKLLDKRPVAPDPKFNSVLVAKFTNGLIGDGKKSIARRLFYEAIEIIDTKIADQDPIAVFEGAMENVRPRVEVKSRRVGGATYQVPVEVRPERRNALAIRWIIGFSKGRSGQKMSDKLAAELLDAYNNRGASIKKKDDTHKMAEANKAFAHYRW